MGKIIGIDLGTTNSAMSVLEGGNAEIIVNADGGRTTPSVVGWKGGDRFVGKAALNQQVTNPKNTVSSVKRFMGRTFDDLTDQDMEGISYEIRKGDKGRTCLTIDGNDVLPEEVSAAVLAKLKEDAERFLGSEVTQAIITVPAYFDDNQRQATKDAGKIAGLEVLRIINEPTAAALAYGYSSTGNDESKKILVFDLGGGTFDVSVLDVDSSSVMVVSTAGDNHLGGDTWDTVLCDWLCDKFNSENGIDPKQDSMMHARVMEAARKAKEDLSTAESVSINLPFLCAGPTGTPLHLEYELTRAQFEDITKELLERCRKPILDALQGYEDNPIDLSVGDIDDILLVGGSTRMPAVKKLVQEIFGKEPSATVNPDEVVSMGAAIQGGVLNDECQGIVLLDVCSMSLGIKTYPNGVAPMIAANTPIPTSSTDVFTNQADNQENVEIVIVQGNEKEADHPNNKILGTCVLEGLPPAPAHSLEIEIELKYDVDSIIHVSAVERRSGKRLDATIEGTTKLTDNEVKALAAAESNA